MTAPIPPPDWYPDPSGAPTQRYWDGYKWGDSITPVKVFVSYFRHDEVAVRSMVGDLQRAGFPVWLEDLGGSYAWWTHIIEQIRECTVFLFAFSDGSLNAIPCRVELGYAEDLGLPIVLVQIGEVSRYASDPIVSRQSIDYRNPTAATRSALLAALNDHAAHRAELPDPLPEGPPIPVAYLHRLSRILDRDELAPLVQAQILRELRSALDAKQEPTGQSYRQGQVDGLLRALRRRPEVTDSIVTEVNSLLGPPSADEVSVYGGSMPDSTGIASRPAPGSRPDAGLAGSYDVIPDSLNKTVQPGSSGATSSSSTAAGDRLSSSVFAPAAVEPGAIFLVQVFAHSPEQEARVAALAREFDETTQRRAVVGLEPSVIEGERLSFELLLPGLLVDDPVRSMVWNGRPEAVQFGVSVPTSFGPQAVIGTVTISRDLVPIGHLKFKVTVRGPGAMPSPVTKTAPTHGMHHYRRAFISYATTDRNEVLKRTQMLAGVGIEFFQDILTVRPGELWERRLYTEIDLCDLFLLFWSSAAKKSPWVLKEVRYALTLQSGNVFAHPEILPVIIEGPPPVAPPAELAHLHFNDRMIYFMKPRRTSWFSRLSRGRS